MGWVRKGKAPGREQILSRYEFRSDDYDFIDDPAASGAAAANLAAWTRLCADVASLAPTISKRARIVINPVFAGDFRFDVLGLVTPDFTDLIMSGTTKFSYYGSSYNANFLTVGTGQDKVPNFDFDAVHRISVRCNNPSGTHRWWIAADGGQVDPEAFVGVRYRNLGAPEVFSRAEGFYIGQQIRNDDGAGAAISAGVGRVTAYGRWRWGNSVLNKIFVDIRGGDNTAWVNEHLHTIDNFSCSSSMDAHGSAFGVRFSASAAGYTGQNNHRFDKPCFQIGHGTIAAYVNGAAKIAGQRIVVSGQEYVCTNSGTLGSSAPVHTDGSTVLNGAVNLKHTGRYLRTPVLIENSGSSLAFNQGRHEGGYGPAILVRGDTAISQSAGSIEYNPMYTIYTETAAPLHGIATMMEIDAQGTDINGVASGWVSSIPSVTQAAFKNRPRVLMLQDLGGQAIIGAYGLEIPGMHIWNTFNATVRAFADEAVVTGPSVSAHSEFGLYFSHGSDRLGVKIRLSPNSRAFRFSFESDPDDPLRWLVRPMTSAGTVVTHSYSSPAILTPSGYEIASYSMNINNLDTTDAATVLATKATVDSIQIGFTGGISRGVMIQPLLTAQAGDPWVGFDLDTGKYGGARVSRGAPVSGMFFTRGEFVINSHYNVAADTTKGWRIDTPGRKAWAWTTGQVVTKGSTRSNASKIYVATVAGTAGATAPTHSSGTVTDGTVTWRYVCAEATMTAE